MLWQYSNGNIGPLCIQHPLTEVLNAEGSEKSQFRPVSCFISKMIQAVCHSYYGMWIGNHTQTIEWYFQWCWMIPNPDFKVTPLFDAEDLTNSTRYSNSYSEVLIGTYTTYSGVSVWMTLSDLAKCSMTQSIARSVCNSRVSCRLLVSHMT